MAYGSGRFLGLVSAISKSRYLSSSPPLSSSFSSLHKSSVSFSSNSNYKHSQHSPNSNLDEQFVLNQLSDLLPINPKPLNHTRSTDTQIAPRVYADRFLSPADKLRGVFLQKLSGKAAIESALTHVGVDLTLEVVAQVVDRGNLGGKAMVTFFNWAIKQPPVPTDLATYQIILKALGRRKYFDFMQEILCQMSKQRLHLDCKTLSIVMDSFVRARLVTKAVKLLHNLEELGLKCDSESLNVLLVCLCRRSHVGTATSVLSSMQGKIEFDSTTFNVIIGGWSKLGKVDEVERFIREMVDNGFRPDCLTYSYLLEGLGRAGQLEEAVEIFGKMGDNGCAPDTVSYNVIITNFVRVGKLEECIRYYRDMTENNCPPDIHTYKILIGAFLKSRRVADALELFDDMLDRGIRPNTGTITYFLEPLCSFGPPHAATIIYNKARKVGCEISLKSYKLLLMRLSRFGKCGMVLKIWDEMQSCGYSSDMEVYEYIVNGLCNIGQLENAVLVIEEALRKGFCPGKMIYSKLNNKLLNVNKVEKAYRLFLKVKEARRCENARRFWRANGWHF